MSTTRPFPDFEYDFRDSSTEMDSRQFEPRDPSSKGPCPTMPARGRTDPDALAFAP